MGKDLLTPIKLGALELPNRVIMAPLTRGRAGPSYKANKLMQEYYTQRATAGLIITEATHISVQARGWYEAPDIFTDEDVAAWRSITDSVHAANGRIFCQLWHLGRASHSSFRPDEPEGKRLSVAPSAVKRKSHGTTQKFTPGGEDVPIETPRAMTQQDIDEALAEYANASAKAKQAGFDGVEIHAANGYLLDEFLQSVSNVRDDDYGGSKENRFKFVRDVIHAVQKGGDWDMASQVGIRLSPNSSFNGMGSPDGFEDFMYYFEQLDKFGFAYLHVLVGEGFAPPHGLSKEITAEHIRSVYKGHIMVNVGFTKETGDAIIQSGNADLVSFGRPFIANADLVERFETGAELNEITDPSTLYSSVSNHPKEKGYTDYPTLEQKA